jgi:hypothetical protein
MTSLEPAKEGCHARYTGVLRDATGQLVPGGQITSMLLTLYYFGGARNGELLRDEVDVWSSGSGEMTVSAGGVFEFWFTPEDNVIGDDTLQVEIHRAEFRWESNTRKGAWRADIPVENFKVAA